MGLRGRFVIAMLLVSAITLGTTAVTLFSPLEHRLADDQLKAMVHAAQADRLAFYRLSEEQLRPGSAVLTRIARSLRRGSGADVTVVGRTGDVLVSTDADDRTSSAAARRALLTGGVQQGESGRGRERELQTVVPLTVDGARIAVELRRPRVETAATVRVVRDAFLLAAAISLFVALGVGMLLSRRLVRRLRALRDTALRVARLGPAGELQSDDAHDEVGDLTRALATMQSGLRTQEQARRTFVATASHELRTPLTSLQIMLDSLRAELAEADPDLDQARAIAGRAEVQADRLSGLASDLLDLSRVDAGLPVRREPVPLGELIRSAIAQLEARLVADERTVVVRDPDGRWAEADPRAVVQIVSILIDNVLRHVPDGTDITVTATDHGDQAAVEVHDDGPGIPPERADRIFDRFERGDDTEATPGFGLGLAIARELARRMEGDLRLASGGPGTTFVLLLPPYEA